MTKLATKPSTPRLSETAKHLVVPTGIVATGFPAVEKKAKELGVSFRWWQKPLGKLILAKRENGLYAASIGGCWLSIPRQVGKTFLIGMMIFALCLLRPNLTVIWTAHRLRTAEETFEKMKALAGRMRIKPYVKKVVLGSGDEAIIFTNGSRILFGARERGFGRGFDKVDVVVYDEAQILGENALDDIIPALNQSDQPEGALVLCMGTPPKPDDPSEAFLRARRECLAGEDEDTLWVEFGAAEKYEFTPSPEPLSEADWAQVAKANPSFPEQTPREAILRMRKLLGPDSFRREGAGIFDEVRVSASPLDLEKWDALMLPDAEIPAGKPTRYSLAMSFDRVVSIGVGIPGSIPFVDLAEMDRVDDSKLLIDWLAKRRQRAVVMIDARDPAAAYAGELRARGVKVNVVSRQDSGRAYSLLTTAIDEGAVWHAGQPAVAEAMEKLVPVEVTKGGLWEPTLEDSGTDMAPLRAITLALFGLSLEKQRPKDPLAGKVIAG